MAANAKIAHFNILLEKNEIYNRMVEWAALFLRRKSNKAVTKLYFAESSRNRAYGAENAASLKQ